MKLPDVTQRKTPAPLTGTDLNITTDLRVNDGERLCYCFIIFSAFYIQTCVFFLNLILSPYHYYQCLISHCCQTRPRK